MSAIRRFAAVTLVTIGLAAGCGDDLGRARFVWDAGASVTRSDAASAEDAARDASANARDASDSDRASDASSEPVGSDTGSDVSVVFDSAPDVVAEASSDSDAGFNSDASIDTDVRSDARDGGTIDPVWAALQAKSPSCAICAESHCPTEFVECGDIPGVVDAGGGDASATTRAQLCVDTLVCLMNTDCDELDTTTCYCGTQKREVCWVPDIASGECKTKIERSFETTDPRRILDDLATPDRKTGGGWAFLLSRCLRDNACTTCFGRSPSDASTNDGAIVADASAETNPPPPPNDAAAEMTPPAPEAQPEAGIADDVIADTTSSDAEGDASEVGSTSNDAEDDGSSGEDTSVSDVDSDN